MATRGVTWGRPSERTVAIQKSSAASSVLRASSQLVAVAPGALNCVFNVVIGSVMAQSYDAVRPGSSDPDPDVGATPVPVRWYCANAQVIGHDPSPGFDPCGTCLHPDAPTGTTTQSGAGRGPGSHGRWSETSHHR